MKVFSKDKVFKFFYDNKVGEKEKIDVMVDSDFSGDSIHRKSTSGYVIRVLGNIIYWKSRKQSTVTKCFTFAEYVAMSKAA